MSQFSSSFIIIGERLNTHRERFREAVVEQNADLVRREVRRQVKAGATLLDVNASSVAARETSDMLWILETALAEIPIDVGLVIDSANPTCQAAALEHLNGRQGTVLNSNSADTEKIGRTLELAAKHQAGAMVTLANNAGISGLTPNRIKRAEELRNAMLSAGIPEERQFLDPQVLPLAFDPQLPRAVLESVRELHSRWPGTHIVAGLSNVSFNMPRRGLLNHVFLSMLVANGIDSVICDPCRRALHETLCATQALLGQDEFLATYLSAFAPED